ncbi:glycosyltransferase [Streptomyces sp. SID8379]|uniref:glycosyltransferase family 2 protein n=1 Tax=unclassified Streptomyces TaxID=2593676 RepID=UPI0003A9033E|nr:glycosyltransferase [Streptomyces sp. HmicA12]MYW68771.1 glycosyltransferase [Streptomyces sp. SID8379]
MEPPRVAVLMTSHNRRAATLAALDTLAAQQGLPPGTTVRTHLVDAGSTDGTPDAVRRAHPGVQVTVVGPDVYWGHGMRLASRNSRAAGSPEPTHQLWLHDDVRLAPDALAQLLHTSRQFDDKAVIVGALCHDGATTYSGRRGRALTLVEPTGRPEPCATYNGNAVLLPWAVRERVGDIDKVFRNGMGDYDHGFRARRAGIAAYVAPRHVGDCPADPVLRGSREPGIGVREALRRRVSQRELPVRQWWVYCLRHTGWRAPALMVAPYVTTVVRAGLARGAR